MLPSHWLGLVHWAHRWFGIALLGLFVHLAVAARGTRLGRAAAVAAGLAVLQVSLGIGTVLLQLTPAIRALHAAVGYALWATVVWIAANAGGWRGTVAARQRQVRLAETRLAS